MKRVVLYTRPGCHLCEEAESWLLEAGVSWQSADITADAALFERYRDRIPVIEVDGHAVLCAPITRTDVRRALGEQLVVNGSSRVTAAAGRLSAWLSRHWLAVINAALAVYIGLPFLAPVLEKSGHPFAAQVIYSSYRALCHELPQRSYFLFGEKAAYTLPELVDRVGEGNLPLYPWPSPFNGNELVGYKVALCQRDLAIYGTLLLSGLAFGLVRSRARPISFWVYILIGILPIALDGGSQLVSYIVPGLFPGGVPRESTWVLRTITGGAFGWASAWLVFPHLQVAFAEIGEKSGERLVLPPLAEVRPRHPGQSKQP